MSRLLTTGISATLLALSVIASAAPKGGKGGNEPSGPVEVDAPVTYRVTWFDPEEALGLSGTPQSVHFRDVNSSGEAVGWIKRPDGVNIAFLAMVANDGTDIGTIVDLNDVFADALAAFATPEYPVWRFNSCLQINSAGRIAGQLVPEMYPTANSSPVEKLVVADLDSLAIHDLGTFYEVRIWTPRMTEWGDVLLRGQTAEGATDSHWLYLQTAPPDQPLSYTEIWLEKVDALHAPEQGVSIGGINGSLTMALTAWSPETKSRDPFIYHFHPDPNLDGAPINLTNGQNRKNDDIFGIAEDGTIYGRIPVGRFAEPFRWRASTGWEPFMEFRSVSRDDTDPSVLSQSSSIPRSPLVHKDSLQGFFSVTVTEGDVERFNRELDESPILNGAALGVISISRRTTVSDRDSTVSQDHGFILGYDGGDMVTGFPPGFILIASCEAQRGGTMK